MKSYLVTLTPLEPFFFGGENTFGEGEKSRYYAKSELFPQQTQILGMLRKTLLKYGGYLKIHRRGEWVKKEDKQKASNLTGSKWKPFKNIDLGVIENISHLMLRKDNEFFIKAPFDHFFEIEREENESVYINDESKKYLYVLKKTSGENFSSKDYLCDDFVSNNGSLLKKDDIFKTITQVGNQKDKSEDDKDKFFKKDLFCLKKGYAFSFFVNFKDTDEIKEIINNMQKDKVFVHLGGERSKFILKIEERDWDINFDISKKNISRVILLSDSFVDDEIFKKCDFALSSKKPFRYIEKNISKNFSKSNRYFLLIKGSVFYTDKPDEIIKLIEQNKNFKKIGYNHALIIEKKGEK